MISKNQQKLIRGLELKKFRRREQLFVAEGPKVVGDLVKAGYTPQALFSTTEQPGAQLVTEDELRRISFLQHPQQVLALFPLPEPELEQPQPGSLYLALDGVQDPGNLGTIIRLADWFGIGTIYCSEDTADAWAPKVVQATMGSIARVKVIYTNLGELLDNTTLPVYGTLLDGNDIYQEKLTAEGIIVMGNEGNGISADIRQKVNRRLLIPSFHRGDTAESLNVAIATAITCSEFRRRND
ncbi:MAG: RNA methyltransferase [Prevotella sp.]|nr:RNA methyltransferase [Prevotella sp.]